MTNENPVKTRRYPANGFTAPSVLLLAWDKSTIEREGGLQTTVGLVRIP